MRKKVLIVNRGFNFNGVGTVIHSIVTGLCTKFDFILVYKDSPLSISKKIEKEYLNLGVNVIHLDEAHSFHNQFVNRLYILFFWHRFLKKQITQLLSKYSVDIIHCCTTSIGGVYLKAAKKFGVQNRIFHIHNLLNDKKHIGPIQSFLVKNELRMIKRYATKIISCSKNALDSYFFPTPANSIVLINPIPSDYFKPIKKSYSNNLRLVQVGALTPVKNFVFSIELVKRLNDIKKGCARFYIVGRKVNDDYFKVLSDLIKNYRLDEICIFLDPEIKKSELFSNSDILLLPSFSEGLSIVALEAQAFGVPVIASQNVPTEVNYGGVRYKDTNNFDEWIAEISNIKKEGFRFVRDKSIFKLTIENYNQSIADFYIEK